MDKDTQQLFSRKAIANHIKRHFCTLRLKILRYKRNLKTGISSLSNVIEGFDSSIVFATFKSSNQRLHCPNDFQAKLKNKKRD